MSLKGAEIKSLILRDAVAVQDNTDYELDIEAMTVTVAAKYNVTPTDDNDTGVRAFRRTLGLSKEDLEGLDKRLLDAVKDKAIAALSGVSNPATPVIG